ncbi:hypothetical protein J4526_08985 [Desulfurococcaceae archaeon MEX13E-LK6-19]|nr:hypothetical protein J4526_08985 [Desulfurococcaceae archaeon MEX13E-LK6-19]
MLRSNGENQTLLAKIANFFLYLHWLASFLVITAPFTIFIVKYTLFHHYQYPYTVNIINIIVYLTFAIGPIAFSLPITFFFYKTFFLIVMFRRTWSYYIIVSVILILTVMMKAIICYLVKGSKIRRWSAPAFLLIATLYTIPSIMSIEATLYHVYHLITTATGALIISVGFDLAVFSYIKYRSVLNGTASPLWLIVLPLLWSISAFPFSITPTGSFLWHILMMLFIIIAVTQITLHTMLYKIIKKKTLSIQNTG